MADVESTPPEALGARAKGLVYAKTVTSRRAQQRRAKQQKKRELVEAGEGVSAQEILLTTEGERKRKRETAPLVPAKKSKVAATATAAGPVRVPKVGAREVVPPAQAKKSKAATTATAAGPVRSPNRSGHSHAAEWAAHERADYEARIMRYQEENDQLRAELARALANAGATTASAMRPSSPLDPSDFVLLPASAASLQDTFDAAPSPAIGYKPSRAIAMSSPQVCSWIVNQLSPITTAVPTTTPPTATAASEPTYDALDCLLYSGDVDTIMDYQMQYLWTNFDDDAALGVLVAEPPITTSTTTNEDAHSDS